MPRRTLLDFFDDVAQSSALFLLHDDGYRTRGLTYSQVSRAAAAFAARLHAQGLRKGDTLLIWCENRPGWIVAFWGAVRLGVIVVPIDFRASHAFLDRVAGIVGARLLVAGDLVEVGAGSRSYPVWQAAELEVVPGEGPALPGVAVDPDDTVEIIFTSGATAEPKGVIITHRNVLANIVPIEREIAKYRKYARPFAPIRFLNLLPLSHMFGQAMAAFVPAMLEGVVVFMRGYNPAEIVRQVRERHISVVVSVPKILDVLRSHVRRIDPAVDVEPPAGMHWLRRWWRYRRVHRELGWKFWSFVVGAAPLDADLEAFWVRLGFVVVQGYGLTETAPIVTLNHPFSARRGSVGRPIAGVEVKLAEDGEILVRGENVTRGYYKAPAETARAIEGGWLHTGDIGGFDESGQLFVRGRKKEMIVTPEGLNVFPEDVERVVNRVPGVLDSAVVGRTAGGEERVHAVLLLAPDAAPEDVVRQANTELEEHQKIRSASVWPGPALPRTEGTRKLRRREVKAWVDGAVSALATPARDDTLEALVAHVAGRRVEDMTPSTTLDELGLSSLDRVELLMEIEARFDISLDEAAFAEAATVGGLRALVAPPPEETRPPGLPVAEAERRIETPVEPVEFPRWNRHPLVWLVRRLSLPLWILPLTRIVVRTHVAGVEHLAGIDGPVIFAANHQSHLDTPVILGALPARWRYALAVAMAKEFFKAHFFPKDHPWQAVLTNRVNYVLAACFFGAFPLPQREAGTRQTLRYVGELLGEGVSILIFPEGKRTEHGEIRPFRHGIGMMAGRLNATVVPIRLEGLDRILHHTWRWPRRGSAWVCFGPPLTLSGEDYAAMAAAVQRAVEALGPAR